MESKCHFTGSTLKKATKNRRLDHSLTDFLNPFYFGLLKPQQIETILKRKFKQTPWRFDEKRSMDSFQIYHGRVKSYGNLEPFITYVVLNNDVIGTHITLRIRSRLDCLQVNDGEIPDLLYLSTLIPERINFPFETEQWTEDFHSKIWVKGGISDELQDKVCRLIGASSASR